MLPSSWHVAEMDLDLRLSGQTKHLHIILQPIQVDKRVSPDAQMVSYRGWILYSSLGWGCKASRSLRSPNFKCSSHLGKRNQLGSNLIISCTFYQGPGVHSAAKWSVTMPSSVQTICKPQPPQPIAIPETPAEPSCPSLFKSH